MTGLGNRRGFVALSPLFVLLVVFFVGSLVAGDFYRIPITVAFIVAAVYAVAISGGRKLIDRIDDFSRGAANPRIMYMIWIFVLAGAFAAVAKAMGAIDATVNLALSVIPANFVPAGIFLAACFISMAVGTSVGTIVALTPVVTGLAAQLGCDTAWMVAIVVGGAFFGDNLSFISDTTIAATQTQGCQMKDKFRTNLRLVAPAAVIVLGLYVFMGADLVEVDVPRMSLAESAKVIPYLVVIVAALAGMNVLGVLLLGIVVAIAIGVGMGSIEPIECFAQMGQGVQSMAELIIVTMLAGGLLEMVRLMGGLDFVIARMTKRIKGRKGGELAIVGLTALANICTANNTIAILTMGDISRNIAQ
ncbi:MAG: Na+/H+ antiporter NhaC family protein, partial [Tidjanibacter sp.]|nr:Na+/H+ antiporter NhaC family protein [Tidjanibacter sp.]